MNKQNFYRKKYQRINNKWKESTIIYHDLISDIVFENTYLLDVGCGHSNLLSDIYLRTPHTFGIDPDTNAIKRNKEIEDIRICFVEKMPFKDNFFDVIVCAWVLEHLENPKEAFQEIYRVLKPGGKVIFLTPNALNYNVWIIRIIPEIFHDYLTKKLYNRNQHDTFNKKYRINSTKRIDQLLSSLGYRKLSLILNGDPSYISFGSLTFCLALILERFLDNKFFEKFKVHIIGEYEKI